MNEDQLVDLKAKVESLAKLLEELQPGLFTWECAVSDRWADIVEWDGGSALDTYLKWR